ncbi:MAG: beta strand repeat-containing protein [Acidimicrobiales bacterium]
MSRGAKAKRILCAVVVVAGIAGVGATAFVAAASAGTAQASNFNISVMSPGEDEGTLSGYQECNGTQGVENEGYWAFPSRQSPIDNGLQTDIGNDQGMLKLTFDLPSSVNSGTVDVTAPNPPRPTGVPGSAPWGTVFPQGSAINAGAPALYGCNMSASTVPPGSQFITYYYAVSIQSGSDTYVNLPGGVIQSPTAPNQVGIPFSFPSGASSSTVTVYIANVVNPTESTYSGVNYTVGVDGSTSLPAPAQGPVTYVNTTPDSQTSQLTSSLTPANPNLTATNVPSDGAVLTATIYDAFYNPVAGEAIYIGVAGGPGGAETAPIGSAPSGSGNSGNGEPTTGSNGQAQYYAYGTTATPPGDPDLFFAQDTTSGIFVDEPPPAAPGTLATVAIPIVAADPNPPSVSGSDSSVSVTGGAYVSAQETQVTADGTSAATVTITLADQFGNADSNQAIVLQPTEPNPPAPTENFKKIVISPVDPPTPDSACDQGPSSQIPGISCTDDSGTTQFTITDTVAQSASFEITDLTDGYVLPNEYFPADVPNVPIVDFLPGLTSQSTSTVSVDGAESANVLANGTSAATINVNLVDAEGNAEIGKVVSVAGSAGTNSTITAITPPPSETNLLNAESCPIPAAGTTDCNGNAYFSVTDSNVETVTYIATDETDTLSLTNPGQEPVVSFITGAVSATNSTVSASPPTIVGDGQGVTTVTVTAMDGGNHALDGETVSLNTLSEPDITVVPPSATTNASGVATFQVRSAQPLGLVNIPVTIGLTLLSSTANITFTNPPDPANTTVTASPPNPEATNSPDEVVTATVEDSTGTGIAGLSVELLAGSTPTGPPTTTDGSGVATFDVGALLPGPVTYTAVDLSDNDRTIGTVIVTFVPVPDEAHESSVTASPLATYTFVSGQPLASQSSTVTVTLKDSTGTPIAGDTVALAPSSVNAVVTPLAGGISNSNGVAKFTVTDPDPEQVTFTATDTSTSTQLVETAEVSFVLRPNENTTSTITVISPNPIAPVPADGHSAAVIAVQLQNNGVLLRGNTVSLSQGSGDSVITTSDPVSNASGYVYFTVTNLTAQSVAYQATDLTTATELTHDVVVTFTASGATLPPSVTSISPTSGPGTGGTAVTVTGLNFTGATAVQFGTQFAPTFSISNTGTEIVAVSPIPVAAGSVNVTVTGPEGTSQAVAGDVYTYTSAPPLDVKTITPSSGPVAGGTSVTLTGTGLAGTVSVRFGDVPAASFKVNPGGTSVTAVAPKASGADRVDIAVTAGAHTSPASPMDVYAFVGATPRVPAIKSVSPASGPVGGGTLVKVTGSNLTHAIKVEFAGIAGSRLKVSSSGTSLSVRTPAAKRAGTVRVIVITSVGKSAKVIADKFTYLARASRHQALEKRFRLTLEGYYAPHLRGHFSR